MTLQKQLEHAKWQLENYVNVSETVACNIAIYQQEVERLEKLIADEARTEQVVDRSCCTGDHANAKAPWTCKCPCHDVHVESADIPVAPLDSIGE